MAAFNKFNDFVEQIGLEQHNLNTDTLKVFLTNTAPNATTHTVYTDLSGGEPGTGNGYTAGGEDATNVWSETGGTATLTGTDITWTASGAGFGPIRYAVLYNDTNATDMLICWWDYGSSITTVAAGETFTVDFATNILTLA